MRVIDMFTIKPLDRDLVLRRWRNGRIVVLEDHLMYGGLATAISTCWWTGVFIPKFPPFGDPAGLCGFGSGKNCVPNTGMTEATVRTVRDVLEK